MIRSEYTANLALQSPLVAETWQEPSPNAGRWNRQHTKSSFGLVVLFSVVSAIVRVVFHG